MWNVGRKEKIQNVNESFVNASDLECVKFVGILSWLYTHLPETLKRNSMNDVFALSEQHEFLSRFKYVCNAMCCLEHFFFSFSFIPFEFQDLRVKCFFSVWEFANFTVVNACLGVLCTEQAKGERDCRRQKTTCWVKSLLNLFLVSFVMCSKTYARWSFFLRSVPSLPSTFTVHWTLVQVTVASYLNISDGCCCSTMSLFFMCIIISSTFCFAMGFVEKLRPSR